MPTGLLTISQYTTNPPSQIDVDSVIEVRGWYSRSFIAGDLVTPIQGNSTNGNEGPYYPIDAALNADGDLVVAAHEVQATTLSNPTANYFEGLWVDGAFVCLLMPNTEGATGWQIPTVYGDPIAFDEIATYNRARRLLYPPDTYFTADQVIQEIERLAGNFAYMAVGVNGIGQASFPPVTASVPIVLMENDPKVGSWVNILAYFASTGGTAAANTVAINNAITAAAITGAGLYIPIGSFSINTISIDVPVLFAPGSSIFQVAAGQVVTFTKSISVPDLEQHFFGPGTISLTSPCEVSPQWWGATDDGSADASAALAAMETALPSAGSFVSLTSGSIFRVDSKFTISTPNITWLGYGATLRYQGNTTSRILDLTADNNSFYGITFSGNNSQAWGCLVYVDDDVDNPKFIDCTFKDISVTTHVGNQEGTLQVYGVMVSPFGVTNFVFRNCLFYNLTSTNTAFVCNGNTTLCEGFGFIGGIAFVGLDLSASSSEPFTLITVPQPLVASGTVEGCMFDTIKTILPTVPPLTDSQTASYDDGDAIRAPGVGYDAAVGVKYVNLRVSDCYFTNVSKRAIKFSGVSGLTVSNCEVVADQGAYGMNEVIKMYGNSIINGLNILTPGKLASLTRSGTTVTATVAAHGYETGDLISIIGATQPEYNGRWSITKVNANSFTYVIVVSGAIPDTTATGTIRSTRSPQKGIQLEGIQNTTISNVVMESGGLFIAFVETAAVAQRNLNISNFACDNLYEGGIYSSSLTLTSTYGIKISNGYLGCTGDNSAGMALPTAASGLEGECEVYGVRVRNGNVKIGGRNNTIDGLTVIIDRAGFNGPTNAPSQGVVDLGLTGATNFNVFRDIHVNISAILSTYLTAPRAALITVAGDSTTTQNLSLRVPTNASAFALSTSLPHIRFYGNDCVVDGVSYWGNGFLALGTALGTLTNGSVYRNLSRLGVGLNAAVEFLLTTSLGTNLVIQNVSDQRTTASAAVNISAGGPNTVDGIASLSSMYELGINDSFGTIRNSYRISNALRKEANTIVASDGAVAAVLAETIFLTAAAPRINVTLAAPSTGGLTLILIAAAGTSDIGVIPGSTADFIGTNPTFGTGSGDVGRMILQSSSTGLWYEISRRDVP